MAPNTKQKLGQSIEQTVIREESSSQIEANPVESEAVEGIAARSNVKQWLAEIKTLQQKLAEAAQERDAAYASATNWRSLYETEARQRRTEASLARQTIDSLKTDLQALQALPLDAPEVSAEVSPALHQKIAEITDLTTLQAQLAEGLLESSRLAQALRAEQAAHSATRTQLTTALGDAIDQLNQERSRPGQR